MFLLLDIFPSGKYIQSRSRESLVAEAEELTRKKDFKGYIHDVGGPTANFLSLPCEKAKTAGMCRNRRCLAPTPCKNLKADHSRYIATLRALRAVPGVKKVFIRSGIRYDYVMADKSGEFIRELARHHVSGELKVAPEHCAPEFCASWESRILTYMSGLCKNLRPPAARREKSSMCFLTLSLHIPGRLLPAQ